MSFINDYKKRVAKKEDIITELLPPDYFLHSGNYSLNKLLSGDFSGGLPQGRLTMLAGHASSGKSLIAASVVASVLRDGGFAFVVDTEHSLDDAFMANCGVDVDSDLYQYVGVHTIPQATAEVNTILKMFRQSGETMRGIIMVDSLDMLLTETEKARVDKDGDIGGDQGQQAKQVKQMLGTWVHSVSGLPVTIVCTKQPYVEQDKQKAYEEPWKITESWQFAFSQILTFEKLNFKTEVGGKKTHQGFTLKARTFKNRHAREKQVVKIEVPFDNGVDPFSGLIEIAVEFGVVSKNKGWYTPVTFEGAKFQQKKAEADLDFMNMLLEEIKKVDSKDREVNADLEEYVSEVDTGGEAPMPALKRREKKAKDDKESE
jgi:recombination protein RecA